MIAHQATHHIHKFIGVYILGFFQQGFKGSINFELQVETHIATGRVVKAADFIAIVFLFYQAVECCNAVNGSICKLYGCLVLSGEFVGDAIITILCKAFEIKAGDGKQISENNEKQETKKGIYFPADNIKTAKDINSTINKIFAEYQKIYNNNYGDIKNILQEAKALGKNINTKQVDNSIAELQQLYTESKNADAFNLRLNTLAERLKALVNTEKPKH